MIARALITLALWAGLCGTAGAAELRWRLEQPDPPAGAPFLVALGSPGSLTFWGPNRGLLAVEGNAVVPRGILAYDGSSWHTLATVCGGPGDTMRIAWAGPAEFWTVSEPSRPRQGSGTALCHFKDGTVVGSYSTADNSPDPYRPMNAAACNGPNDCWFGGIGSRDPAGTRVGAFHLHWDGTALRTVYNSLSGRAVTDIVAAGGGFVETVAVGARRGAPEAPDPLPLEAQPALLHRISGSTFADDPFLPALEADGGSELLAVDADASGTVWAVGGGAASGPVSAERGVDGVVQRPPLAALSVGGGAFQDVPLRGAEFGTADRFEDVAVVPDGAWAALVPFGERGRTNVKARVAKIARDGQVTTEALPAAGSGRGAAARIAFTSPTDGWLVTNAGWLFHYSDGSRPAPDTDPAFAGPITARPNEAAEQFVPDSMPADDSQLFAPPPVAIESEPTAPEEPKPLKALITNMRKPKLNKKTLVLSLTFKVTRKARIQLLARRKGKTVAKTKNKTFKPGRHTLRLKLSKKRWPTALRFRTKELTIDETQLAQPDDDTVVTTGGQ